MSNNLEIKFVGINSRGNKCYITQKGNYIENINSEFFVLNQYLEGGLIGIEGEPDYKLDSSKLTLIE